MRLSQRDDFGERDWCFPHPPDTTLRTMDVVQLPHQDAAEGLDSRRRLCCPAGFQVRDVVQLCQDGDVDKRHWHHPHGPDGHQTCARDFVQLCQDGYVDKRHWCHPHGPDGHPTCARDVVQLCQDGNVDKRHWRHPHGPDGHETCARDVVQLYKHEDVHHSCSACRPDRRQTLEISLLCEQDGVDRRQSRFLHHSDRRQTLEISRLCEQDGVDRRQSRFPHRPNRRQASDDVKLFEQDDADAAEWRERSQASDAYGLTTTGHRHPCPQGHCCSRDQNSDRVRRRRWTWVCI